MKIKIIKRCVFVALLAMPLLFAVLSFVSPYIHGTAEVTDINPVAFSDCLRNNLPDIAGQSYFTKSVVELWEYLTGVAASPEMQSVLWYIGYGINIYLLWVAVDVFLGLPTILHKFIDKGVYNE